MLGSRMKNNAAHNRSVQTAYMTALFTRLKDPKPQNYLVDLKTGELKNKANGEPSGQLPAQEALAEWWSTLDALGWNKGEANV